ncbi:MAG: ATP phosphoribosyltransferase regulatory subunit [Pseudomonadota bacterium]
MLQNERRAAIRAEAARIEAAFVGADAMRIEADALLDAGTLLDLYGEDIRGRAYVTNDPVLGERMMRPDFTVPLVERHMAEGAEPARYCYNGPVWRMQEPGSDRPSEYVQVGFELFARDDRSANDAEVFHLFTSVLPGGLRITTGDVGLLTAAVAGLSLPDYRRAALMRHLWRPKRFAAMLDRFSKAGAQDAHRADLITKSVVSGPKVLIEDAGKFIGQRSEAEILARIERLTKDAQEKPLPEAEGNALRALLGLETNLASAAKALDPLAEVLQIGDALSAFSARVDALDSLGVDLEATEFAGAFGRTSMEYYDGFVFAFSDGSQTIASGGRYDALTRQIGQAREIPAVGGVIRPETLVDLGRAS